MSVRRTRQHRKDDYPYQPKTDSGKEYQAVVDLKRDAASCTRVIKRCQAKLLECEQDSDDWKKFSQELEKAELALNRLTHEAKGVWVG